MDIHTLASENDAIIFTDHRGRIAIQKRYYNGDGTDKAVPPPRSVDYHPESLWEKMAKREAERIIWNC